MKILHIVGARPQFIKLAPLCRLIKEEEDPDISSIIVHTGQHYDYLMSKIFFDQLQIPSPNYNLEVGSGPHGQQTASMLAKIEGVLLEEKPDIIILYGDTNSTLAGALAGAKLNIPMSHVEAGLRSYNRKMPEEINRLVTDHLSTLLFCPTKTAILNLKKEGFTQILEEGQLPQFRKNFSSPLKEAFSTVINVGDIMYDALIFSRNIAEKQSIILKKLNLLESDSKIMPYCICTIHRQENTDTPEKLQIILEGLNDIAEEGIRVIFPIHPRTQKLIKTLHVASKKITIIPPVTYFDMLALEKQATVILTDSGGVQKEAFLANVPCITLRAETEWVETVEAGINFLVAIDRKEILENFRKIRFHQKEKGRYSNPYGKGNTAQLILKFIKEFLE